MEGAGSGRERRCAIQDQIVDGESGVLLSDPGDLPPFGAAVVNPLEDRERARRIGVAANARIRDEFLAPHVVPNRWWPLIKSFLAIGTTSCCPFSTWAHSSARSRRGSRSSSPTGTRRSGLRHKPGSGIGCNYLRVFIPIHGCARVPATHTVIVNLGITTTYSAVLLMTTREEYMSGDGCRLAVRIGLRETGAAATGAGLVMIASLIPFLTTSFVNVRQFGIGVAVAVLLDTLVVRPVLLPAAEIVLGRFGWWPTSAAAPAGADAVSSLRVRPFRLHPRRRPPGTVHE